MGLQIARLVAGEQQSLQRWRVARRLSHGCAGLVGEQLCHEVGLLGGHAALLDRVVGRITDRVGVGHVADPAVPIDRDESFEVVGQARDRDAARGGHRHHPFGVQRPRGHQHQHVAVQACGVRCRVEIDPALGEQPSHGRACTTAEYRERFVLRGHERQLHRAAKRLLGDMS